MQPATLRLAHRLVDRNFICLTRSLTKIVMPAIQSWRKMSVQSSPGPLVTRGKAQSPMPPQQQQAVSYQLASLQSGVWKRERHEERNFKRKQQLTNKGPRNDNKGSKCREIYKKFATIKLEVLCARKFQKFKDVNLGPNNLQWVFLEVFSYFAVHFVDNQPNKLTD